MRRKKAPPVEASLVEMNVNAPSLFCGPLVPVFLTQPNHGVVPKCSFS